MIDLYTWPTPNGHKVHIMLEEVGLAYTVHAIDIHKKEANRLYAVVDRRLADREYLAGAHYTIADMAAWPWMRRPERQGVERDDYPNFKRWFEVVEARPAVARGVQVLAEHQSTGVLSDEARRNMFGDAQYARR